VRVAYHSPLPPEQSGIADYSALLLPALQRRIAVDVVPRRRRWRAPRTDIALYHVGNSPEAHGWIVEALRKRPGLVVLHEIVLHHLVAGMTIGKRNGPAYLDAMERDSGLAGRLLAHGVLEGKVPPLWESRPEDFPLVGEILDLAAAGGGLIVHSRYMQEQARAKGYEGPVWRIPHPAWPVPEAAAVAGAGAAVTGAPIIGCFGHVNASKRVPQLLEAFAVLRGRFPEARLLLVGPTAPRFELQGRIDRLGLGDALIREEYVPEDRLWSLMAAADIHVCLRAPTMGETSGSALRALSLGKPLVVSDVGWFSELPDDVALKVPVDETEPAALAVALAQLAGDAEARAARGAAALALARSAHAVDHVADLYAAALEQSAGGGAVGDGVLRDVAAAAAAVGIDASSPETGEIAARLREVSLGG